MKDAVLVIGAGVAGMTAAIELADSNIETVLIDRLPTAGGNALDLYKAFPTDDCFYCFEGSRSRPGIRKCFYRSALIDQPNLHLRTDTEVAEISGSPGSFTVKLTVGPRYVDSRKCILCGLCLELSNAFEQISPQCQPQAVIYRPDLLDDGAKKAESDCPTKAINLNAEPTEETVNITDIVLATGYHEMQPINVDEYSYGKHPNIITQLELAKILDPNGESGGALLRPSDGAQVKNMMMIQCVGSRDENYYAYCSKICCVFALKHAKIVSSERNGIGITVVYMDMRTYDRHERYYRETRDSGVRFLRGRLHLIDPREDGTLDVTVYDSLLNKYLRHNIDLLVLSSALEPPESNDGIIQLLDVQMRSGFIGPSDPFSENEVVAGDHLYVCGSATGPTEVPESVTQARAVVSKILQGRRS
ncbi:MAG: CoB--CoM heterodisulfide reductase iron-sulfur subunit A family protein [Candidatus Thorarchaeota archaeon]|nr:MAG: CoB--CoM heterodisulfide reductase iron-sulfur subunit A family protein [Candidatus Thorarchaeota archaeon]